MAADMKMTRARAIEILKLTREWVSHVFGEDSIYTDVLDIAIADMEKVLRRQKLMKRDLIRRAKARKDAAQ